MKLEKVKQYVKTGILLGGLMMISSDLSFSNYYNIIPPKSRTLAEYVMKNGKIEPGSTTRKNYILKIEENDPKADWYIVRFYDGGKYGEIGRGDALEITKCVPTLSNFRDIHDENLNGLRESEGDWVCVLNGIWWGPIITENIRKYNELYNNLLDETMEKIRDGFSFKKNH